jgi:dUTP pyrophosphatase
MNVKIKKLHPDAVIPQYATAGAAAFDLVATKQVVIEPGETVQVPLGLAVEVPEGHVLIIAMRSGISLKTLLRQTNGVGVIDSDYRGEINMLFTNTAPLTITALYRVGLINGETEEVCDFSFTGTYLIKPGDRVAQGFIMPLPKINFVEGELSETERGTGGFGSTGTK